MTNKLYIMSMDADIKLFTAEFYVDLQCLKQYFKEYAIYAYLDV